jgi:hypothetical protein
MKASAIPTICSVCLATMSAAGVSHWWSVAQFVTAFEAGITIPTKESPAVKSIVPPQTNRPADILAQRPQAPAQSTEEQKFFETLTKKIDDLENKNRDLGSLMAETSRDLVTLGYRVDTHSDSFRPLPVGEGTTDPTLEDGPGVLPPPPRAEIVFPLEDE